MASPWVNQFDVFKQNQLGRLWVSEEDFLGQTGISFDSYRKEFDNISSRGGDIWALDNLIWDQYRALRDTNQSISDLNAQEWAVKRDLINWDRFFTQKSNIQNLINQWITDIDDISARTWYDANVVQSLIKGDLKGFNEASGFDVTLSGSMQERIEEETWARTALERAQEDYDFNKSEWELQLEQIKEDFQRKIDNQKRTNQIVEQNMNKLVWFSWAGYSNRGVIGMENILQQSKDVIDQMKSARNRAVAWVETYLDRLSTNYNRKLEDIQTGLSESVMNSTQIALNQIETIKWKYWEVSKEGIQNLTDATNKYVETINDYNNQAFDNMQQQFQMLQSQVQLANSINEQEQIRMNQEVEQLIDQWVGFNDIMSMVNSGQITPQAGAKAQNAIVERGVATLNSFGGERIGELFRDQIIQWLTEWKTASQVLQEITASEEFANAIPEEQMTAMQQAQLKEQNLRNDQLENDIRAEQGYNEYNTGTVAGIGTWTVTSYWTDANPVWLDVDWIDGESDVSSPVNGTVVNIGNDPDGFGNYVTVEDEQGNQVRYAHLHSLDWLQQWMSVGAGMPFAKVGKTGNVIPMNWGDWSHVDITLVDSSWKVRSAIETEQYINSWGSSLWTASSWSEIMWALGVPVTFERSVKNLVPATLMNSEIELTQLNDTIKAMHQAGLSDRDAALVYMWFNVQDESEKKLANNLIDIGRSLPEDLAPQYVKSISDMINGGNTKAAIKKAENTVYTTAKELEWDSFVSEWKVKTVVSRSQELWDLIQQLEQTGQNPIGVFDGRLEKWLGKFKGKEATEIANRATQLIAKMRTDLIGTQSSQGENNLLEPLIPDLADSAQNFSTKLERLREEPLRELNNVRNSYLLPELDEDSLLWGDRTSLYMWWEEIETWGYSQEEFSQFIENNSFINEDLYG